MLKLFILSISLLAAYSTAFGVEVDCQQEFQGSLIELNQSSMKEQTDKTILSNIDDIGRYFMQIGPTRILSREEEIILGNEILALEKELRTALFKNDYVFEKAIEMIDRVYKKDVLMTTILMTSSNRPKKTKHLTRLVSENIESLKEQYQEHQKLFSDSHITSASKRQLPGSKAAWRKLSKKRSQTPKTMSPFMLRIEVLESIYQSFMKTNQELQTLAKEVDNPPTERHKEYYQKKLRLIVLMYKVHENKSTLEKKIAKIKKIHKDYYDKREKLAKHNLKLVVSIAKTYQGTTSISLFDLIQSGNIGLARATQDFDPSRGNKFSTYATTWIRSFILDTISRSKHQVYIPVLTQRLVAKLKKIREEKLHSTMKNLPLESFLYEYKIRELTETDIIKTPEEMRREALKFQKNNSNLVKKALKAMNHLLETDAGYKLKSTGNTVKRDFGSDTKSESLLDFEHRELKSTLYRALSTLSEREIEILKLRRGLDGYREHTLREVGETLNISPSRTKQIEKKAFKKLLKNSKNNGLHVYDLTAD